MAYYTGTVNDLTALRQALIDACGLEDWSWSGTTEVLSKSGIFLRVRVASGNLELLARTSETGGDAPGVVRIGPVGGNVVLPAFAFPMAYEVFVFAAEVYLIVNYSVDCYQWCAFGKSTVSGVPGTGMWIGASKGGGSYNGTNGVSMTATQGAHASFDFCPALSWATVVDNNSYRDNNFWLHSDLDSKGWWLAQTFNSTTSTSSPIGIAAAAPLIGLLPNGWNSEAVLLPIRAWMIRSSNKISLTADLEHARYTRVDNYAPGEIITIGSDRWKVFPWYRKNTASRNGGVGLSHTGTFGWAIRYEGP